MSADAPETADAAASATGPDLSDADPGVGLWIGLALGLPVMAWGITGLLAVSRRVEPAELGRWILGAAVLHDAVAVPLVLTVGWAAREVVPPVAWPPVRWALATSGVVALLSWPFVRGYGRTPRVPSLLDRDYTAGLIALLVATWVIAAIWTAARVVHARRHAA